MATLRHIKETREAYRARTDRKCSGYVEDCAGFCAPGFTYCEPCGKAYNLRYKQRPDRPCPGAGDGPCGRMCRIGFKYCGHCNREMSKKHLARTDRRCPGFGGGPCARLCAAGRASCKECAAAKSLAWFWGLTLEAYGSLLAAQGGTCAVCGQPPESCKLNFGSDRLAIDHCHKTNIIRGLLCAPCNMMLGLAKDLPGTLRHAAHYLESWRDLPVGSLQLSVPVRSPKLKAPETELPRSASRTFSPLGTLKGFM